MGILLLTQIFKQIKQPKQFKLKVPWPNNQKEVF